MKLKPTRIKRRGTQRIDKLRPAAHPDWYKDLRRLMARITSRHSR